jgi:molybdate transport system substrate-binding protein
MRFGIQRILNMCRGFLIYAGIATLGAAPVFSSEQEIVVFAAASTTEVIKVVTKEFERRTGFQVTTSFAGSGTLAKQIEQGAPVNIFISANKKWLMHLAEKGMLQNNAFAEIASNQLVLVAPKGDKIPDPFKLVDLAEMLDGRYLAIGNPDHVPVGMYTRAALKSLKVWEGLKGKYVKLPNVRAVAALVEKGEAPYGIIYKTGAKVSKNLQIVTTFPPDSYPKIIYGIGIIKDYDSHAAREFVKFVRSPLGKDIFDQFGFITLAN